ncbi:MAG TPA: (2Fe-2S)-binding protein [Candidatus Methylomirabilis sp.]|nr:(2Fe-2S)-binding protein [Candidatus Methylomirabilis sp.]
MSGPGRREVTLGVNGSRRELAVEPHWTLLQVLRDELGLMGTREGCGEGACGTCTVLVDGELARACLVLALRLDGQAVLTIEGMGGPEGLHPIQQAFVERGGSQCGFCTPGMIMTAKALLDENLEPADDDIKAFMSGNLCRCGSYSMIFEAIRLAAGRLREADAKR